MPNPEYAPSYETAVYRRPADAVVRSGDRVGERVTLFNRLSSPVILVTQGRGAERFGDSSRLFARLAELRGMGEKILSIQTAIHAVSEDGIEALETMLETVGFRPFRVASKRRGNPFTRFGTRWSWAYLSDYLGWQWRPLR